MHNNTCLKVKKNLGNGYFVKDIFPNSISCEHPINNRRLCFSEDNPRKCIIGCSQLMLFGKIPLKKWPLPRIFCHYRQEKIFYLQIVFSHKYHTRIFNLKADFMISISLKKLCFSYFDDDFTYFGPYIENFGMKSFSKDQRTTISPSF
jgi:hypothetical protein